MKLSAFEKGLLSVLIAALFFGGLLFTTRVLLGDTFNKEEAQHAINGLWLFKDVRAWDWGNFWYDTQRQMYWPFLHSWLLSFFFLLLGPSYASARFLSLVVFVATLILMYFASDRFCEKHGRKIGILSVFLALTSPIMLRFATENTLEGLGALIFLASLYFYTICEERKLFSEYIILGLLIGLSIYTNYLYAYLMIPAFMLVTLVKLGPLFVEGVKLEVKGEKAALPFLWWAYRKLIVLGVLLFLVGIWFFTAAFSRKIMLFLQAVFRYSGGEMPTGFGQALIYYPKAIIENFTFSPWLGALILLSLLKPFVAMSYRHVNKLYTFIWTILLLATLTVPTKAPQFIYIIAPFLFMVFSAMVFYWVEKLPRHKNIIFAVILVPALLSFPKLWGVYFPPRPAENARAVMNYFRHQVLPRYPVAASFNLQHLNPEVVAFHFWDWNAPVLADPILGEDEMFDNSRYLFALEIDTGSPYHNEVLDDSVYRWNLFLQGKQQAGEIREYSQRRFASLGLTARIYEKAFRQETAPGRDLP